MVRETNSAYWMEKKEIVHAQARGDSWGWKSQREVSIIQYDPDPVKHGTERKKRFLVDGMRPTTIVIMALLKAPC